ncbi:unnamed protein product [Urochloa humidicola]
MFGRVPCIQIAQGGLVEEEQSHKPIYHVTAEGSTNELGPTISDMSNLKRLSLNDSSPTLDPSDGDVMHAGDLGNGLPDSTIFMSSPYVEALSPRLEKYLKEHSVDSFEDACAYLCTADNTFLVGAAAAEGDRYEDQPVPAPEQGTPSAGQHSKASKEDIAQNGKKWMTQEVKVAFEKYMEGKDHLKDHMYEFDELQHQCFSVENYYKIFHHFNFTMKMKAPGSMEWTTILFFAELKEILRRKMYFCCPLEPYENGHCHACKNQGMDDLKHPVIGAFDRGSPDTVFPYMYESDSSEESAPVRLEDEAEDESYVFDDERSHGVHWYN